MNADELLVELVDELSGQRIAGAAVDKAREYVERTHKYRTLTVEDIAQALIYQAGKQVRGDDREKTLGKLAEFAREVYYETQSGSEAELFYQDLMATLDEEADKYGR